MLDDPAPEPSPAIDEQAAWRGKEQRVVPDNKIDLNIVVNGRAVTVDANVNAPLRTAVPEALRKSGNVGEPDEWELRDEGGNLLDISHKIGSFGFTAAATLFLSRKAGVGG